MGDALDENFVLGDSGRKGKGGSPKVTAKQPPSRVLKGGGTSSLNVKQPCGSPTSAVKKGQTKKKQKQRQQESGGGSSKVIKDDPKRKKDDQKGGSKGKGRNLSGKEPKMNKKGKTDEVSASSSLPHKSGGGTGRSGTAQSRLIMDNDAQKKFVDSLAQEAFKNLSHLELSSLSLQSSHFLGDAILSAEGGGAEIAADLGRLGLRLKKAGMSLEGGTRGKKEKQQEKGQHQTTEKEKKGGGVPVLCVTHSGDRAFDIAEEVRVGWEQSGVSEGSRGRPLLLYSHGGGRKQEQVRRQGEFLRNPEHPVGTGTPGRIRRLLEEGWLEPHRVAVLVVDLSCNVKNFNVASLNETRSDLAWLLCNGFRTALEAGICKVLLH
uniref:Uncharacterized protein n=1 Tax=Chromera velia CCMP2878 TaxID=1169474 RepID=A0A0G4G375_9ALVE|mmetsp:Transcript_47139/g.93009  ORF Transcript_47139/g.93009 Transcript_47139/m.93009 type:complete len:377 (-) Transcript_47139:128-1258(-)|eukprot:Cvel_19910.t1-p1 / transcript=Cvel_19910.t1 / gene=Cvel_19910 / organism=Chromera_velia_CCMP2878 / gene_product=hypothetical protein / transcript_product=hypothetical protein / location=Cvel_scaffold1750:26441-29764(-) / protein_length=376 / sequence_SO=supercontig / SO=protein_coding / is_pseudo=false